MVSDLSQRAVLAYLSAHGLATQVAAVAARDGVDMPALDIGVVVERAATLLNTAVDGCLLVSGSGLRLRTARRVGALAIGCEVNRDPRKHLAPDVPVVSNLAGLAHALDRRDRPSHPEQ